MWCDPVALQVGANDRIQRDIELHAATIRGSFDRTSAGLRDSFTLNLQLCFARQADQNPWFATEWTYPLLTLMPIEVIGQRGGFAFERLPARCYVLRLISGSDDIVWTRAVRTVGDEVIDLGRIEVTGVEPRLECRLQPEFAVIVRQRIDGNDRGAYVRTVMRSAGSMGWGRLPPERYRLQACRHGLMCAGDRGWRLQPVGDPVDVEVHADGSCTPAIVWPEGLPAEGK